MGDGRGVGFAENSVSAHHRKLLNEAKEFTDKANQLSNLVDERKAQLENRVKNNIPFNKEELAEAEILGVKVKEDKSDVVETDDIRIIDGNIYYKDKKATTAKAGYAWFTNNKSRFNGKRESIMLPEFLDTNKKQTYRYYLTQRPPAPGAIPRGSKNTVSFDTKQEVDGLEVWGYVS